MADDSAEPKPDKDFEPIHFTENYRRAKRNALFWAAITIVIAVLSAHPDTPLHLALIVRDMTYGQSAFATAACTIVLIFMMFGYKRAEATLLARHSGFAVANRLHEAGDLADTLVRELADLRSQVHGTTGSVTSSIKHIDTQFANAIERIRKASAHHDAFRGNNGQSSVEALPAALLEAAHLPRIFATQEISADQLRSLAQSAAESARDEAARWLEQYGSQFAQEYGTTQQNLLRELETARVSITQADPADLEHRLAGLSGQLHGFADSIGTGERRWFYWHDRAPVWALASVALVAAALRIFVPAELHDLRTSVFPEPTPVVVVEDHHAHPGGT